MFALRYVASAVFCCLVLSSMVSMAVDGTKAYQACYDKTYKSCMSAPVAPPASSGSSRQDILNYLKSTANSDPGTNKIYAHMDCQKKAETSCNQLAYKAETKDPINKKCLEAVMADPAFRQKNARLLMSWDTMGSVWLKAASEPLFSSCVDLAVHEHEERVRSNNAQQSTSPAGGNTPHQHAKAVAGRAPSPSPAATVVSTANPKNATKPNDETSAAEQFCQESDGVIDIQKCIADAKVQFALANKPETAKNIEKPGQPSAEAVAAPAAPDTSCADAGNLQQLEDQCRAQTQDAASICNDNTDPGLSSAATLGDQLASGLQGIASTVGACTQVAQYGTALNGAMATYNQNCISKHQLCVQSCEKFKSALAASKCTNDQLAEFEAASGSYPEICSAMKVKSDVVAAQGQATISGIQQATNCADSTSATALNLIDCKANPTAPNCVAASTDCSNPQVAATSAVCACSADPTSTACRTLSGAAGSTSSASLSNLTGTGGASVSSSGSSASSASLSLGNDPAAPTALNMKPGDTKLNPGGGAGGVSGGGFGSAGKGKSGSDGPAGRAGSRFSADILGGTRGSSATPAGRGFGSDPNRDAIVYNGMQKSGGPDLRKFLPGGALDPKRGLAGASGPDGMTGPHTDLFAKVTNRYRIIESTLLP